MKWGHRQACITHRFGPDGIAFSLPGTDRGTWWTSRDVLAPDDRALAAYLDQLLGEGAAIARSPDVLLPLDALYAVRASADHQDSIPLLRLPPDSDWVPRIVTRGALSDATFQLTIAGWRSTAAGDATLTRVGAVLESGRTQWMMPEPAWRLVCGVIQFAHDSPGLTYSERLRAAGKLRDAAKACGAGLDDYLAKTDIRTPDTLQIALKRETALDQTVVEIAPVIEGATERFIDAFDRYDQVQSRYDIPGPDGQLAHIAPGAAARAALAGIKRLPGRRLSSDQASLFAHNPYAILGEEAAGAIDEAQLAAARADAGLLPTRLRYLPDASAGILAVIELVADAESATPERQQLNELRVEHLCAAADRARSRSLPIFAWEGNEILRDAAAENALRALGQWLAQRHAVASAGLASTLLDLAAYSPRVIGFDAKVQAVPYVAHQTHGKGWLPDDDVGIATADAATGKVQKHRMTPTRIDALQRAIDDAVQRQAQTLRLPDSDVELTIPQAESLVSGLRDLGLQGAHPPEPRPITDPKPGHRAGLRIHYNIESLDYVEAVRQLVGQATGNDAVLPDSLNPGVQLLAHQTYGLAWLQRRYRAREDGIAGALLADDMGLGKTLESLSLMAWAGEQSHFAAPSLVVAPVSLLDNWKLEVAKFLDWPADAVLSLYGSDLAGLRVPPGAIREDLAQLGVRKVLRPGFAAGFRLVLTTYETLRDYQLSIAREHWDVVVCDEAQKIKNPTAFVTQAAKALQANFRIACTGTPVENTLADLWCLFDFFQPGRLGALNGFTRTYRASIEGRRDGYEDLVERLRGQIDPWVLRRLKTEVHGGLPRKLTGTHADPDAVRLPMSPEQFGEYTRAVALYREARQQDGPRRANSMLALLQRLRMICACPLLELRPGDEEQPIAEHIRVSPKLAWLVRRLEEISRRREKAIVFTDYRKLQRLLQRTIEERFGFRPPIVNGATSTNAASDSSRQKLIDTFQQADGFGVLILGTTAVGFGVNIQRANHVIHFTRSWNPAKEDQATDRAYRIGQTRDVYVYCPTVAGRGFESFEERLGGRLDYKRALSTDMLAGPQEVTLSDFDDL